MSWLLILLPLLGSFVIIVSPGRLAKQLALVTSLVVLGVSVAAAFVFDGWGRGTWELTSSVEWVKEWGLVLQVGADSVSLILVLLTTFLMPLAILGSFNAIKSRTKEYYGWLLGLQAAMTGVFLAQDLVLFYVCFEFTLVPMFFIIAIWGSKNRAHASVKFLIYTFTGSLITLAGFLTLAWSYAQANGGDWSFEISALTNHAVSALSLHEQAWLLLALLIGFGVKVPLFPVHTWLPLAHTEAPTAGSVILAGVLLKLGTYGLYRFVLPMCPEAVVEWAPFVAILSIIGILYAALICWVQTDVKKLIAYSSVSHLGFCVLGLFALNPMGVEGSILYMINHGLSTGALFFLIGMMYERYHTRTWVNWVAWLEPCPSGPRSWSSSSWHPSDCRDSTDSRFAHSCSAHHVPHATGNSRFIQCHQVSNQGVLRLAPGSPGSHDGCIPRARPGPLLCLTSSSRWCRLFFIIAIWGSKNRAHASVKFLIYTFTGSLITLAGFLTLAWSYAQANGGDWSFEISALTNHAVSALSLHEQAWLLLALLIGFGVKVPLFPVHTWLPLAHTEAPTAGSVILAGVLLKLGTYGLYRFVLPMCPEAVVEWAPFVAILSIIGILYAALICWVQTDVKKLIAYSSVSHLGFCVLGLFALNPMGVEGSILYMINHGLSTGALFFLIGMMYERYHTRDMGELGGLARTMPIWATFMVFFVLASVGLPGLNGFVSEFLCLIATFTAGGSGAYPGVLGPWYAAIAALGMVLAAMYLLIMVGKVVFGPTKATLRHDEQSGLPVDLTVREITVLVPLAVGCIVLGIQPDLIIDNTATAVADTLAVYQDIFEESMPGAAAFVDTSLPGGAR